MNTTTITFISSTVEAPQFVFGDRIAVTDTCEPQYWATGRVIGMCIDGVHQPIWCYTVQLDAPQGFAEEYIQTGLVPEAQIPVLQGQWQLS